jgi:hypothetical protein
VVDPAFVRRPGPDHYCFVNQAGLSIDAAELPKTSSGKIKRAALRAG